MRRLILPILLFSILSFSYGQRQSEELDRGLVAIKTSEGIFLSWRITGFEWMDAGYNIYKNGTKINQEPLTGPSNYLDAAGSQTDHYAIAAVINGFEQQISPEKTIRGNQYFDIPINLPPGGTSPDGDYTYSANDGSIGDLDGDGDMEIILKWDPTNSKDNANDGYTGDVIIDAYTLEGDQLWRINLGRNIRAGAHYTQFMVADLDGDGKAEMACKTADGTVDGVGNVIGNPDADYRNTSGRILTGPEFLTIFNGETGEAMQTINYQPARGSVSDWGDSYGNRVDRFLACIAYLDGEHPSLVMCRGYYERTMLAAYDWNDGQLTLRWLFNSESGGLTQYSGQGNHNLSVADVDNDGKDEIVYGSMTIDDDGTGLYTTRLGHGDALHVSDMDPDYPGLEVFAPHESGGNGVTFREAATGKVIWQHPKDGDIGRGVAADIVAGNRGFECWASSGLGTYDKTGEYIGRGPSSINFAVWWDGDPLRELLDHDWSEPIGIGNITKYNNGQNTRLLTATGTLSNNWTKGNPVICADILGDWREEVIWRRSDNRALRLYISTYHTDLRIYTLLHDSQYRGAIAWQNVAYNQPPHTSFFMQHDAALPVPSVFRGLKWKGAAGQNNWNLSSMNFSDRNGMATSFSDGDTVIFSFNGVSNEPVNLTDQVSPGLLVVASPDDYTLSGTGSLTGIMSLYKSQKGSLTITGDHAYSGKTVVTDGALIVDGTLENSQVIISGGIWGGKNSSPEAGGRLGGGGHLKGGLIIRDRGALLPGMTDIDTLFIENGLTLQNYSVSYFDLSSSGSSLNDLVVVKGDLTIDPGCEIIFNLVDGELNHDDYVLFSFTGEFTGSTGNFNVTGLDGVYYKLVVENQKIILRKPVTREPGSLIWSGTETNIWGLNGDLNWKLAGQDAFFLPQDSVLFDDSGAEQNELDIQGIVYVDQITVNASADYTFSGEGHLGGKGGILKKGSGDLEITSANTFAGSTVIENGVLAINSLSNGDVQSNLGMAGSDPEALVINGGELWINSNGSSDKGLWIGPDGGMLNIRSIQEINGLITGTGELIKKGYGILSVSQANSLTGEVTIKAGTVKMLSDDANAAGLGTGRIILENATLEHNDSRNTSNATDLDIYVPEGADAKYIFDGRVTCRDKLTGSGNLEVVVNYVRTEFEGDWSEFTGLINVTTDTDGGDFRVTNTYGYPESEIIFNDKVIAYHLNYGTISIGNLQATQGSTMRYATWKIGTLNKTSIIAGKIDGSSLLKEGTGQLIISGNSNIYQGGTIVNGGSLWVQNSSGSATGSGIVIVKKDAALGGSGFIAGDVEIESGGYLSPGDLIETLTINATVGMYPNSILNIELSNESGTCDLLKADTLILYDPVLFMINKSSIDYKKGDQFKIIDVQKVEGKFSSIYPRNPAEGLFWNISKLYTEGIISVTDVQTSVIDNSGNFPFRIYPNPTRGKLHVDLLNESGDIQRIEISDARGGLITQKSVHKTDQLYEIDLSGNSAGLYFLRIISGQNIYVEKILLLQ